MGSNSFGTIFRITTFGESHGKGVGVVIDGCPSGIKIHVEEIQADLERRKPGQNCYTSPRKEPDRVEILSGIFQNQTTGAPIALFIANKDVDSSSYEKISHLYRPGHAQYTYEGKYGHFDFRGGGRASGRETAARVAAGAIARKFLKAQGIESVAFLSSMGEISSPWMEEDLEILKKQRDESPLFCPDLGSSQAMEERLEKTIDEKDSIGGIVSCLSRLPLGLGEPIYEKIEAKLAFAMLSIPASKGFEIGEGFQAAKQKGSEHNDLFLKTNEGTIGLTTNHCGGALGGISTGTSLFFRVPFKPTSSIQKPQKTLSSQGTETLLELSPHARHDPCIAIRAVFVVEAMTLLVLADLVLQNQSQRKPQDHLQ